MKTAVLLAAYTINDYTTKLGKRYIQLLQKHFKDADIYVGINLSPLQDELIQLLNESGLNIKNEVTPEHRVTDSDASAYQTALRLLKSSGKKYDLCFFMHYKGATYQDSRYITKLHLQALLEDRIRIESLFARNKKIGLYSLAGWTYDGGPWAETAHEYIKLPYPIQLQIQPIFTFYVIRGSAVQYIIKNATDAFFDQRLPNRYFFENIPPQMVFGQGYEPYIDQFWIYDNRGLTILPEHIARERFENKIIKWRTDNNIQG